MPSWNELVDEIKHLPKEEKGKFLLKNIQEALNNISKRRNDTNVIFYASAFLQKPDIPPSNYIISKEDINGFMSTLYGMDWGKGLTLLLHTPGGDGNAAESIVEYLLQKFKYIEVIIPTYAMSAGTMISMAANKIIMGRHSQLGPIDSQMYLNGRMVSAQSIVDQFEHAKKEILKNPELAMIWYPILQTVGPAMLQEAKNALKYSSDMIKRWLKQRMFNEDENKGRKASRVSRFLSNASIHKSHGHPINRDEIRAKTDLNIEDLEKDQDLQEYVLTAYHLITIAFHHTDAVKIIESNHNRRWIKNWNPLIIKQ